jgi:hypothetical protein
MNEALRRPLDMLIACLSAGRTFHFLEKGGHGPDFTDYIKQPHKMAIA